MKNNYIIFTYIIILLLFFTLLLRYGYLQIYCHQVFLKKSVNNYSLSVINNPIRGIIYDRNGVILADNKLIYKAVVLGKNAKSDPNQIYLLTQYIQLTDQEKNKYYKQVKNLNNSDWVTVKDNLTPQEVSSITAHNLEFPNIQVLTQAQRKYNYDGLYAHSIGYVSKINSQKRDSIDKIYKDNYNNLDLIGISGVEEFYEKQLRGYPGIQQIQVNAYGDEIKTLSDTPRIDGNSLQLTLDQNLQVLATKLLQNKKGAVVALDPKTGGILAFVSQPSYNPNQFINGISSDNWQQLLNNSDNPLLDRVSQGLYPPGSIFKPFMAIACLYYQVCHEEDMIFDQGYFQLPNSNHKFREANANGWGNINLKQAIAYSSDVYFYELGYKLGIERAVKILSLFGLDQTTGIDISREKKGFLPKRQERTGNKKWSVGDTVTFAIGQSVNAYTPLQMAYSFSILANHGLAISPHFLNKILDQDGKAIYDYPVHNKMLDIPNKYFDIVDSAMVDAVRFGTVHKVFSGLNYDIAAKTGTAQLVAMKANSRQNVKAGHNFKDHAWLATFAPANDPKIVLVVLIENGGFGGASAGPIARQIIEFYLKDYNNERKG